MLIEEGCQELLRPLTITGADALISFVFQGHGFGALKRKAENISFYGQPPEQVRELIVYLMNPHIESKGDAEFFLHWGTRYVGYQMGPGIERSRDGVRKFLLEDVDVIGSSALLFFLLDHLPHLAGHQRGYAHPVAENRA